MTPKGKHNKESKTFVWIIISQTSLEGGCHHRCLCIVMSSFCILSDAPHLNQLDLRKGSPKEEIKEAFYSLPRNNKCGPDGYSAESFTGYWDIIGAEVCEAVTESFPSGQLLKQWNSTTLVLIPKTPTACRTWEFRPIACLNPVIAKLLASRLRDILSHFISPIAIPRKLWIPYWLTTIQISWLTPYASKAEDFWIWKFRGWAVKTLSYAGRLLLISTVISGTVNFWCSTFMLPKGCVKKIVSLCSRFLWSGQIEIAKGAKVNLE